MNNPKTIEELQAELAEAKEVIAKQQALTLKAEQAQAIHLAKNSAYVKTRLELVEKVLNQFGTSWKGLWNEAKPLVDSKLKSGEMVLKLPNGEVIPAESYKF